MTVDLETHSVENLAGPVQPSGNVDGPFEARFEWIYGLVMSKDGEKIYAADPVNEAVRVIDQLTEEGSITGSWSTVGLSG